MSGVDIPTLLGAIGGILAIGAAIWKGVPELRRAGAERDAIVADTYQQVIGDVRDELSRLRDEAAALWAARSAARDEAEELRRSNRELRESNRRLTAEVEALRLQILDLERRLGV